MKLTCEQFASNLSLECGINKDVVYNILNMGARLVGNLLLRGHEVGWFRLGTIKLVKRAPKRCRNPKTGETITSPEHTAIRFVPSKELRKKIR